MAKTASTRFNLDAAADLGEDLRPTLDDTFFAALEQSEILGGNVDVALNVKRRAGGGYRIGVKAQGTVRTACDRCLDDVELPVDVADEILLTDDADAADANPDLVLLPNARGEYDAAWQLYEIVLTALPMIRTHPDGQCNPDMLRRIATDEDDTNND